LFGHLPALVVVDFLQILCQIANKERILAQKEVQLKNQFARLEETMSRLKAQGSYLQARMGGGGDMGFNLKGG
jgi:small-conductance mechanosensitive channel